MPEPPRLTQTRTTATPRKESVWHRYAWPIAGGLVVIAILSGLWVLRESLSDFLALGYAGAFLVSMLGASSMLLPAPAIPLVFILGGTPGYIPVLVGLLAGLGETVGELVAFGIGKASERVVLGRKFHRWLVSFAQRHGVLAIFLLAVIPNPVFDLIGVAAGMSRMPLRTFVLAVFAGKTVKGITIALAGAWQLEAVAQLLGFTSG